MGWQFYALAAAVFASLTAVLTKVGLANVSSNMATLIRTFVIIIFLSVLVFVRREWVNPALLSSRSLFFLGLSGLATGLSWICYFRALQLGPTAMVFSIDKLSLIFVVIFSLLFLGEHMSVWQWGGVILTCVGIILMIVK